MERYLQHYWAIYYALYIVGIGVLLWIYWDRLRGDDLIYVLAAIFAMSAGGSSAAAVLIEFGGRGVLLIPAAVRKLRNEGRVEGREEGREEGFAESAAWFERYLQAQSDGEEFTEAPPWRSNGKDKDSK